MALVASCGDDEAVTGTPVSGFFPLEVGPAGGTVTGAPGTALEGVSIEIPAGALGESTVIDAFAMEEDVVLGPTAAFVGPKFAIVPDGLALSSPARLTVPLRPSSLDDYEQQPEGCRVWYRQDGAWAQVPAVGSTATSVSTEVGELGAAAAGVVFTPTPATGTTLATCESPTGYCVSVAATLAAGAAPASLSIIAGGKLAYHRADPVVVSGTTRTRGYGVVELDLASGKSSETPKWVTTKEPGRSVGVVGRVSRGLDGTFWAPVAGFGTLRYGTSAPTQTADKDAITSHLVHTPDGRRWRFEIAGAQAGKPEGTLSVTSELGGKATPLTKLEAFTTPGYVDALPLVVEGTSNTIAYVVPNALGVGLARELTSPQAAASDLPLGKLLAKVDFSTNALDELAVSADGKWIAVSLKSLDATGKRLYIASRDGATTTTVGGLPNLAGLEFASDGGLWTFGATAAELYRIDPATGKAETIPLTNAAPGSPEYAGFIPITVRVDVGGDLVAVVGKPPHGVVRVEPNDPPAGCDAAITCGGYGQCNPLNGGCDCDSTHMGLFCDQCAEDFHNSPSCNVYCNEDVTCSARGLCTDFGQCTCETGYAGANCARCDTNYYNFPNCKFCTASGTCSAHGLCNGQGNCLCDPGFTGSSCGQCATNHYNYPTCKLCTAATTCSGKGTCNGQGNCLCNAGYAGTSCNQCAGGYTGYPNCVPI